MSDDFAPLDLSADRKRRAAENEGKRRDLPIIIEERVVATLPTELPLDVLSPLRELDSEIALLLRTVMQAARNEAETSERWDAAQLFIDLLASSPNLPVQALDVITKIGQNLLGESGWAAFIASRPSREDIAYFAGGVVRYYGVTLGESRPSSESSTEDAGQPSNSTSPGTTESTPEVSGTSPALPASSESGAS